MWATLSRVIESPCPGTAAFVAWHGARRYCSTGARLSGIGTRCTHVLARCEIDSAVADLDHQVRLTVDGLSCAWFGAARGHSARASVLAPVLRFVEAEIGALIVNSNRRSVERAASTCSACRPDLPDGPRSALRLSGADRYRDLLWMAARLGIIRSAAGCLAACRRQLSGTAEMLAP